MVFKLYLENYLYMCNHYKAQISDKFFETINNIKEKSLCVAVARSTFFGNLDNYRFKAMNIKKLCVWSTGRDAK